MAGGTCLASPLGSLCAAMGVGIWFFGIAAKRGVSFELRVCVEASSVCSLGVACPWCRYVLPQLSLSAPRIQETTCRLASHSAAVSTYSLRVRQIPARRCLAVTRVVFFQRDWRPLSGVRGGRLVPCPSAPVRTLAVGGLCIGCVYETWRLLLWTRVQASMSWRSGTAATAPCLCEPAPAARHPTSLAWSQPSCRCAAAAAQFSRRVGWRGRMRC